MPRLLGERDALPVRLALIQRTHGAAVERGGGDDHGRRPLMVLPARQFLQLVEEVVDLLVAALLFGALLHFVLVRELIELELE